MKYSEMGGKPLTEEKDLFVLVHPEKGIKIVKVNTREGGSTHIETIKQNVEREWSWADNFQRSDWYLMERAGKKKELPSEVNKILVEMQL
jgi:hypothetical protein